MRTCTPNPHVTLQLLQSEVTQVVGVQLPGAAGGEGLLGRPTPASKTAVGPGGGGASLGLLRTAGVGEDALTRDVGAGVGAGVTAGVVGASVGAAVGNGVGAGVGDGGGGGGDAGGGEGGGEGGGSDGDLGGGGEGGLGGKGDGD